MVEKRNLVVVKEKWLGLLIKRVEKFLDKVVDGLNV